METKANTAVIGAFTLAVLAFAFGFIYWLADSGISKENMTVVFGGPVAGLDVGSEVYFNGIPVGNVRALQFDANDPSNVLARISVDADTPIKKDSKVSLGYTGITGFAYVDIVGGTSAAENRLDGTGSAVMFAERSAFEDLVAGARQIMTRADTTLQTIEDLVTKNAPAVENTLGSVEKFTGALAENSDEVSNFLESISGAANAIAEISGQLEGVVAKAETLLADLDSTKVQETIDNIAKASARLDGLLERSENIIASVDPQLVQETAEKIASAAGRIDGLVARGEEIAAAVDPEKIGQTIDSVSRLAGDIESFVKQGEQVLAAVDPAKVSDTVDNVSRASGRLDGLLERGETLISSVDPKLVTETAEKIASAAGRVDGLIARTEEIAAAVDPEKVRQTVDSVSEMANDIRDFVKQGEQVMAAIDPVKVGETVDNMTSASARLDDVAERTETILGAVDPKLVGETARNIAEASGRLDGLIGRGEEILTAVDPKKVGDVVDSVSRVTGQIEGFVQRGDTLLAAVDPEKVSKTVDGITSLATTFTERRGDIDNLITSLSVNLENAKGFTARLPEIGRKAEDVLSSVDVAKINQSIENVHQFTTALGNSSEDVDAIVANIKAVSEQVSSLLVKIDGMAGSEEGEGLVADARAMLKSVKLAADTFTRQADSIGGGVNRFTNQGLREIQAFVREGRRAVSRLDRLIANIDRNPSQVLFGGDNVPRYRSGQRR